MTECRTCHSPHAVYRNTLGHVDPDDDDSDYEWCRDQWHEPFFFEPPLRGQVERELEWGMA